LEKEKGSNKTFNVISNYMSQDKVPNGQNDSMEFEDLKDK